MSVHAIENSEPLYGLMADFLPLGRNPRKNYLVLATAVACMDAIVGGAPADADLTELAVRNVIHGLPVQNRDALANPGALDYFRDLAELRS